MGQLDSRGMHWGTCEEWGWLELVWERPEQGWTRLHSRQRSCWRPEVSCWGPRLYISPKPEVFSLLSPEGRAQQRDFCGHGWRVGPAGLCFQGAAQLPSVHFRFLSNDLKTNDHCWMNEGMCEVRTGAAGPVEPCWVVSEGERRRKL